MAHDEALANRIRRALKNHKGVTEKNMFGGLTFMLRGNMCCGVEKHRLMVRVGAENHKKALSMPHAKPMDFTGRPLKGFVYVMPEGVRTAPALKKWLEMGVTFVKTLPKK